MTDLMSLLPPTRKKLMIHSQKVQDFPYQVINHVGN